MPSSGGPAIALATSSLSALPSVVDKASAVGLGRAPIPYKLLRKIMGGHFVDLADLLSINLCTVENEPETFLNGKLVVLASKYWEDEITDIFTLFQIVVAPIPMAPPYEVQATDYSDGQAISWPSMT